MYSMLSGLQGNMPNMSFNLCGKHSKHPQKENGTTFPRFGAKSKAR